MQPLFVCHCCTFTPMYAYKIKNKSFCRIHNPVFHLRINLDVGFTVFNQKYFSLPKSYFAALQLWCDGNDAPE